MMQETSINNNLEIHPFTAEIHELWDALNDHGPHAIDESLRYCLKQLSTWMAADHASWHGTLMEHESELLLHEASHGWRIAATVNLSSQPDPNSTLQHTHRKKEILEAQDAGIINHRITSEAGHFRTYRLSTELNANKPLQNKTHCARVIGHAGLKDRIWIIFPVSDRSESYFVFDRYAENKIFNTQEMMLASQALRAIKWFHQSLFLSYGLGFTTPPLTRKERSILHDLLLGLSERAIAKKNHLTEGSVHQYCMRIYKKYGTRGRIELMSLWLGALPQRKTHR